MLFKAYQSRLMGANSSSCELITSWSRASRCLPVGCLVGSPLRWEPQVLRGCSTAGPSPRVVPGERCDPRIIWALWSGWRLSRVSYLTCDVQRWRIRCRRSRHWGNARKRVRVCRREWLVIVTRAREPLCAWDCIPFVSAFLVPAAQ